MTEVRTLDVIMPSTTDDFFLDGLEPRDLLRFSRTCVAAKSKVDSYMTRRFSVYRILDRYFDHSDSIEFRHLMRSTGLIISGSSALQLFDRSLYEESDLDLFVNRRHALLVGNWLIERGYEFELSRAQKDQSLSYEDIIYSDDRVLTDDCFTTFTDPRFYYSFNVLNFVKRNTERKVQVVLAEDCPVSLILNFHSTVVMNIITYSKAYCLFPEATLMLRRNVLNCWRCPTISQMAVDKYESRGWSFAPYTMPTDTLDPHSPFSKGTRRFGDDRSWTIAFQPLGNDDEIMGKKYPFGDIDDDIEIDTWLGGTDGNRYFINTGSIFHSDRLSRSYIVPPFLHLDKLKRDFGLIKDEIGGTRLLDSELKDMLRKRCL